MLGCPDLVATLHVDSNMELWVCHSIDFEANAWNVNILNDTFNEEDKDYVLDILLSHLRPRDRLYRWAANNGVLHR